MLTEKIQKIKLNIDRQSVYVFIEGHMLITKEYDERNKILDTAEGLFYEGICEEY